MPKFQRVELLLLNCLTQLGIVFDIKSMVNTTNITIGNTKAINNSTKKRLLSLYVRSIVNHSLLVFS